MYSMKKLESLQKISLMKKAIYYMKRKLKNRLASILKQNRDIEMNKK